MNAIATRIVALHTVAHARAGDKGNHSNIGVFAYQPEYFEYLLAQVTEQRVAAHFAARRPTSGGVISSKVPSGASPSHALTF